jgi:hypothetical protein
MEAAVETGLEQMNARTDVFEENSDKMNAAWEACLRRTKVNIKTSQESKKVESKTDLEEIDTMDLEANREKSEAVAVHQEVSKEEAAVDTIGAP